MLRFVAVQLWLLLPRAARAQGDSVAQWPPEMRISEGRSVTLHCNFTTSYSTPELFWYRQDPDQPPQHILTKTKFDSPEEKPVQGQFSASLDMGNKTVPLRIEKVSPQESAAYFCALRDTYDKFIFGSGTQLTVVPKLDNSPPSIYPLTSDNKNLLACLVTDFFPGNISVRSRLDTNHTSLNASLVVMKGSGEASYGTVLWGPRDELACTADHDNQNFQLTDFDEEDDTCMIVEMDENFETDKNLNFLSLTLLGLRIVFVKTVAINLLLTLSQWKR